MKTKLSQLYETDFNLWIEQTVNHLKKGHLDALDLDNLIEEISDMGCNNRREVFSRLKVLLMYLLKWQYQPEKCTNSWINTIDEQREQLELILRDSRFFGLSYAMDGGYKGWNLYIQRHLAIFVNCF